MARYIITAVNWRTFHKVMMKATYI